MHLESFRKIKNKAGGMTSPLQRRRRQRRSGSRTERGATGDASRNDGILLVLVVSKDGKEKKTQKEVLKRFVKSELRFDVRI